MAAAETASECAGMCPGAEASSDVTEGLAVVPGCIRVRDELLSGECQRALRGLLPVTGWRKSLLKRRTGLIWGCMHRSRRIIRLRR